jgi:murein DD-endopeptidase MepM/ murein hydrolase activator NlpD
MPFFRASASVNKFFPGLALFLGLALCQGTAFAKGRKPLTLDFVIDPSTVTAGNTVSFRFASPVPVKKAFLTYRHRKAYFYSVGENEWRALLGLTSMEAPGVKHARFSGEFEKYGVRHSSIAFAVAAGTYPVSQVKLSKEKDKLVAQMERDAKVLDAVYRQPQETNKLWSGYFIFPTTGIVSSVYGARRAYGQRLAQNPHTGVDIANKTGTEIAAPNRGRVVYADWLDSFGNSVVLDHGQGIFSYYLHMRKISVKTGDVLEKGTPLGAMGSEGVATGPHLHWSFVVSGERVDPLEWTRREFP